MARIWQGGFEQNTTASDGLAASGSPAISSTTVRGGSYALQITGLISGTPKSSQLAASIGTGAIRYFRFYLSLDTLPAASNTIFGTGGGTGASFIKLNSDGSLSLWDTPSTQIGSNSATLNTGQWYRVEVHQAYTNAAGSRTLEARIDGTNFATTTTAQITSTSCAPRFGGNLLSESPSSSGAWYFDDCAVNDGSGTAQNSWPGAGAIVHLLPNAAGDNNAWSTQVGGTAGSANNFTRVDDVIPDDASSYNASNTLGQLDDYDCTSLPGGVTITSVTCVAICSRFVGVAPGPNASFVTRCKKASAGTVSEGSTITTFSAVWSTNSVSNRALAHVLYNDPDSAAWTTTTLNSMQIGLHLTATSSFATQVTALWASVDYVSGAAYTQPLTGILTLAGTLQKAGNRILPAGAVQLVGSYIRATTHSLAATLTLTGLSPHSIARTLPAALQLAGSFGPRHITHLLTAGTLNFAGTLQRATARILPPAVLTSAGAARKATARVMTGALSFAGALGPRSIARVLNGILTLTGTAKESIARLLPPGGLTLTGATQKAAVRILVAAALTTAGTLQKSAVRTLTAATLVFAPAIASIKNGGGHAYAQLLSGALTVGGSIRRAESRVLPGVLSFAGTASRAVTRSLTGTLTTQGTAGKLAAMSLSAVLTTAGTIARLPGKTLAGTLASTGSLRRAATHGLTAALSFAGNQSRTINRSLTGTLATLGAASRQTTRILTGGLTLTGSGSGVRIRAFFSSLSGSLGITGAIARNTARFLAAQVVASGAQSRQTAAPLVGSVAASGTAQRSIARRLTASVTVQGTAVRGYFRIFTGTLSLLGQLASTTASPTIFVNLVGSMGFSGATRRGFQRTFHGVLSLASLLFGDFRPLAEVAVADGIVTRLAISDALVQ